MSMDEMVETVRKLGGVLKLEGDNVRCSLPAAAAHLADELRQHKPELLAELARRAANILHPAGWLVNGQRVTVFPRCPACHSYALYRQHNLGNYECQSCGKQNITEATARDYVETSEAVQ
jgi:Zn ribbon nucleic-acid-binding protein